MTIDKKATPDSCRILVLDSGFHIFISFQTRKAHGVDLAGNIIIFDEAHNLVSNSYTMVTVI